MLRFLTTRLQSFVALIAAGLLAMILPSVQSSLSMTRLTMDDGSVLCSVDSPSLTVPVTDGSSGLPPVVDASCVPETAKCAWYCEQNSNCTNFSYDRSLKTCQLFYNRPLHFVISHTCSHYVVSARHLKSRETLVLSIVGVPNRWYAYPYRGTRAVAKKCANGMNFFNAKNRNRLVGMVSQ